MVRKVSLQDLVSVLAAWCDHMVLLTRDGEKIDFFDFLSIRLALSIIDKKLHLSIKNRFCAELQKSQ